MNKTTRRILKRILTPLVNFIDAVNGVKRDSDGNIIHNDGYIKITINSDNTYNNCNGNIPQQRQDDYFTDNSWYA